MDGQQFDTLMQTVQVLQESLGKLGEGLDASPDGSQIEALTQAVQYLGTLKFHELVSGLGAEVVGLDEESPKRKLLEVAARKVPAPPWLLDPACRADGKEGGEGG